MFKTILHALEKHACTHPMHVAFRFMDDGDTVSEVLTFKGLTSKSRVVANYLARENLAGERILLTFDPGLEFVIAFFGCMYAGAIPVPVDVPRPNRTADRLGAIIRDSAPKLEITCERQLRMRERRIVQLPGLASLKCTTLSSIIFDDRAGESSLMDPLPESIAFIQYTSGSTGSPKGVVVTHRNIIANQRQIQTAFHHDKTTKFVGWLPLFHDMGLVGNVLQPVYLGIEATLFPPLAFLQKPVRWLRAISDFGATTSGAPNFAYDHCVDRISRQDLDGISLATWRVAFNGAEPLNASTFERFCDAFACIGFKPSAYYPCYGLAEATLLAVGDIEGSEPYIEEMIDKEHGGGRNSEHDRQRVRKIISSGVLRSDPEIRIVDPDTSVELPEREIGEIWIRGDNVSPGYWTLPDSYSVHPIMPCENRTRDGYLRSGDLGYISAGRLFVVGRLKDLIIIRGRNIYPHDIESAVSSSHPVLVPRRCAAFSILAEGREEIVVVQEIRRIARDQDIALVEGACRDAVFLAHGVQIHHLMLVPTGSVPFTSSGKVRRSRCRELFLNGSYAVQSLPHKQAAGTSAT